MLYPSLLNRLQNQHESIDHIIAGLSSSLIDQSPAKGKWSIKDNIAHLTKYQPVFIERIKSMLQKDELHFERYLAENDSEFEDWRKKEIAALLSQMKSDRKNLFTLIKGLQEADLKRVAYHKKYGGLTIVQWTEFFLLHEAHHIFTVFQLANTIKH